MKSTRNLFRALACLALAFSACGDDDGDAPAGDEPTETTSPSESDTGTEPEAESGGAEVGADTLRMSLEQVGVDVLALTVVNGTATVVLPPGGESDVAIVCPATEPFVDEVIVEIDGEQQDC